MTVFHPAADGRVVVVQLMPSIEYIAVVEALAIAQKYPPPNVIDVHIK